MNEDTPLTEVADHIPADMARVLMDLPEDTQEGVLNSVRYAIMGLEEAGVELDPMQYAAVVTQFCIIVTPAMSEIRRLRVSMLHAAQWLQGEVNHDGAS